MKKELTAKQVIRSLAHRIGRPLKMDITFFTGQRNHVTIRKGGKIQKVTSSMKEYKGLLFSQPDSKDYTFSLVYGSINFATLEDGKFYIFIKHE